MTLEREHARAQVLVVACVASTPERPHYGIFTRRQIDSVRRLGVGCDVLAITGYRGPRAYATAAWKLAQMSVDRRHRYSVVHAHGGEVALAATCYRRAPLVVSYQGSDVLGSPGTEAQMSRMWRLRSGLIRRHSQLAAAVIVKSAVMIPALPPRIRDRVRVIPNGVDREFFSPRDRDAVRAELGWDPAERVVLFASDPTRPSKRLALAEHACRLAEARIGPIRLQIAHGLEPRVMPSLMNASDCLLHPSASEGSPNVVKEALACNLPVVATPVGDIPELLGGVDHCHVCPPDADRLAAALVDVLDPPRRTNGRERSASVDERRIAERLVSVYSEVAGTELTTASG